MLTSYRLLALLLLLAFAASFASFAGGSGPEYAEAAGEDGILPAAIAHPVEVSFEDTLRAGETLSELLARVELAQTEVQALLAQLSEHQDPRRMRAGSVVAYHRAFNDGEVRRMEFRLDPDRTLNLIRDGDDWVGRIDEVEVRADTAILAGVIDFSLYNALVDASDTAVPADERIRLVDLLADRIFAWQIDFSRDVRTGDSFRVMYERLVRPDGSARSLRILAAEFSINSRDYEAYAFVPGDGSEDYFDRSGESVRRAFLRAPLQYRRISSAFSRSRFHPILKVNRPHNGIDYAAATGTPVYAVGDGTIQRAGNGGGYGNVIDISHARGYMTRYAHLNGFAPGIRSGVRVKQGDLIGYVGATGQATGPHLHYEFHANGRPIDPNSIGDASGDPVPDSHREQFLRSIERYAADLNRVTTPVLFADLDTGSGVSLGD